MFVEGAANSVVARGKRKGDLHGRSTAGDLMGISIQLRALNLRMRVPHCLQLKCKSSCILLLLLLCCCVVVLLLLLLLLFHHP
jgi:energy-coupling factor transporter transmembrane protein EcfT